MIDLNQLTSFDFENNKELAALHLFAHHRTKWDIERRTIGSSASSRVRVYLTWTDWDSWDCGAGERPRCSQRPPPPHNDAWAYSWDDVAMTYMCYSSASNTGCDCSCSNCYSAMWRSCGLVDHHNQMLAAYNVTWSSHSLSIWMDLVDRPSDTQWNTLGWPQWP